MLRLVLILAWGMVLLLPRTPWAETVQAVAVAPEPLLFTSEGRTLRLQGLHIPTPWADAAAAFLSRQSVGQTITASAGTPDRYGRPLVDVFDARGESLQAALLRAGLGLVAPLPDSPADTAHLAAAHFAAEDEARRARRGLWAEAEGPPYSPETLRRALPRLLGQFIVAEGQIVATTTSGGLVYWDFGPNWRQDFTVSLPQSQAPAPDAWVGQTVRVRGWLRRLNGPRLDLSHPATWNRWGRLQLINSPPGRLGNHRVGVVTQALGDGPQRGHPAVTNRNQHIADKARAANALEGGAREQRPKVSLSQGGEVRQAGGGEFNARVKPVVGCWRGKAIPRTHRHAVITAIDPIAHQGPQVVGDRARVFDGQVGDAAPRINAARPIEGLGGADVEATAA